MKFQRSYVICSTPRTGSTLLCDMLEGTQLAGAPNEYFTPSEEPRFCEQWGVSGFKDYFDRVIAETTSPNGVFGFKIMMGNFHEFIEKLRGIVATEYQTLQDSELLRHFFPDLRYIWMTRHNKVRQAVSFSRAIQTEVWAQPKRGLIPPRQEPRYRFRGIDVLMQRVMIFEAKWQEYFAHNDIMPLIVSYEDFINFRQETVEQILRFIGVEAREDVILYENLRKQADQLSEIWVERFIREKAASLVDF